MLAPEAPSSYSSGSVRGEETRRDKAAEGVRADRELAVRAHREVPEVEAEEDGFT